MERMSCRGGACLAPALVSERRSRSAWGRKSHRCGGRNRLAGSAPTFRLGPSTCIQPASEYARTVTHRGRQNSIHDYNTLECRSQHDASASALSRCVVRVFAVPSAFFFCDSREHDLRGTVRTSVCAALVSLPSDVYRTQPCDWLPSICQSKRRHYPDVAPGNAVVGKLSLMPAICHANRGSIYAPILPDRKY